MSAWFDAMETRETYRGTQSDYHTHAHDLPPQMGGCYENGEDAQKRSRQMVDEARGTDGAGRHVRGAGQRADEAWRARTSTGRTL